VAGVLTETPYCKIAAGVRPGENDNWIAGFCRYYGQPIISRDAAFDRVRGLRRT